MSYSQSGGRGHPGGLLGAVMNGQPVNAPRTSPWLEAGGLILSALGDAQTGGDTNYLGSALEMQNRMREREAQAWEMQQRLRFAELARQRDAAARGGGGGVYAYTPVSGLNVAPAPPTPPVSPGSYHYKDNSRLGVPPGGLPRAGQPGWGLPQTPAGANVRPGYWEWPVNEDWPYMVP